MDESAYHDPVSLQYLLHLLLEETLPLTSIRLLPLPDLLPGPLVDGVVDGYDRLHVLGAGVVALPLHGVEEHLLARVDPVAGPGVGASLGLVVDGAGAAGGAGGLGARDGRDHSVCAEVAVDAGCSLMLSQVFLYLVWWC